LANGVHSKTFICQSVIVWKNCLHLLVNQVHCKTLISTIVRACKNYPHLLANWVHSKAFLFEQFFELVRLPTSIGQLSVLQNFHLIGCLNL
jgi:hypothetical protein